MKQPYGHTARSRTGQAVATIAVALLCVAALGQPSPAYAEHGGGGGGHGGGGFHGGGGGGFHGGGGGGFHAGGGFHGGGGAGFHSAGGFHGGGAGFRGGGGIPGGRFPSAGAGFRGGEFHRGFGRFHHNGFYGGGFYQAYPFDDYSGYDQPAPAQAWYYCADPAGYYPYVTQCNTGWQGVPVN